ncbi:MAG TPA: DUF4097 family beta strand repeat-containing protein [Chloroflexota bacterium]|nr:DUF4097 family beta strand repeat-containing protein [Chloroflexota bacterium]
MLSRSFLPLALITLGVVFLLGNVLPGPGRAGLILLGLGAAFAIGRVTTGRYGYSVPAGILIAIGCYVVVLEMGAPRGASAAGAFFLLLGGGFVLTYLIGMRPHAVWPLIPAAVLICLGLLLFGWASMVPVASFAWIVNYWPVVLVLLGLWLLFRDKLPTEVRAPVATVGGIALLGYGILAAIASVASAGTLARPWFMPTFGGAPFNDEITLDQPMAGQTFTVTNTSGRTVIHGGSGTGVHVIARRHFWNEDQPPRVSLVQRSDGVTLEMPDLGRPSFGPNSSVDLDIEVPGGVQVNAESSSGSLDMADILGPVHARTSSGSQDLKNIGGELYVTASSGQIRGSDLAHVRDVQTSSGAIRLQGVFNESAQVRASSGSVQITFAPASAVGIEVRTSSGGINARNANLSDQRPERNSLSATLGSPAAGATLQIQTSSGSVTLSQ